VTTVLFDWDGTLCDSGAAHLRAFEKALADFGIGFTRAQYQAVYTPAWYRMYQAFGLPESQWKQADQRWLHHYRGEEPGLVPGARDVLDSLRAAGHRLGIVTGGTRARIDSELARLRLSAPFGVTVCHEDVVEKKPDPEGIVQALAALHASTHDACFVGDTPEDIEMGKRAGVFTVGVVSDYVGKARLEERRPDALLDHIADLPATLARRDVCDR
jgi:HAD superfamily hydrolase (TIGR01549 family)